MQLGMVGLGRMGANMVRRLMRGGHEGVVFDLNSDNVKALAADGASGAATLDDFVSRLDKPRAAWVMVPAGGPTEETVQSLADRMEPGDIIIDGGNSYYKDDVRRAAALEAKGLHYVDVGTSGGVWGVEQRGGYYNESGALRDMVPNHIFQLISLTAMEPPISFEADAVRDEQAKTLNPCAAKNPCARK